MLMGLCSDSLWLGALQRARSLNFIPHILPTLSGHMEATGAGLSVEGEGSHLFKIRLGLIRF